MRQLTLASIVLALTFCRPHVPPTLTPGRSAALPPGAAQMLNLCSRPAPAFEGSWALQESDVEQLERDLPRLRGMKARGCCLRGARVGDVDAYVRQYVGLTIDGRRYVYINAFPASSLEGWPETVPVPDWRRELYDVCDGGSSWGVLYDVTSRRFSDLSFNGIG